MEAESRTDHLVLRGLVHRAGSGGNLDSHRGESRGKGAGEGRGYGLACEGAKHVMVGGEGRCRCGAD
jgi:hypothetical protein